MKSPLLLAAVSFGILTGCSTMTKFDNRPLAGDAAVRCVNPAVGGLAAGDAFVYVENIDGAPTRSIRDDAVFNVRPGKHRFALHVSSATTQDGQLYCEIEAVSGRQYRLSAVRRYPVFVVTVADDSNPKAPAVLALLETKASRGVVPSTEN